MLPAPHWAYTAIEAVSVQRWQFAQQAVDVGPTHKFIFVALQEFSIDWSDRAKESKAFASPILSVGVFSMAPNSDWMSCHG